MKWGVIGYGSIGKQHSATITALGDEVVALTNNVACPFKKVSSINELLEHSIDFIVICNETNLHHSTYVEIRKLNLTIPILIEKPIFEKMYPSADDTNTFVAYCLRFHPVIKKLKALIGQADIIAANFYCGQYLPTWRPERNYQDTYSAQKKLGGGVLRDLSHEIDLAQFFAGDLKKNYMYSSRVSELDIDTDDIFVGHFQSKSCQSISIELNYLDRVTQRYFTIITNEHTYKADVINAEMKIDNNLEIIKISKNEMFINMLSSFKEKVYTDFCNFASGLKIIEIFDEVDKD